MTLQVWLLPDLVTATPTFERGRQSWTCKWPGPSRSLFIPRWQKVPGTFLVVSWQTDCPRLAASDRTLLSSNGPSDLFNCGACLAPSATVFLGAVGLWLCPEGRSSILGISLEFLCPGTTETLGSMTLRCGAWVWALRECLAWTPRMPVAPYPRKLWQPKMFPNIDKCPVG